MQDVVYLHKHRERFIDALVPDWSRKPRRLVEALACYDFAFRLARDYDDRERRKQQERDAEQKRKHAEGAAHRKR